jgi:hypothetical protein
VTSVSYSARPAKHIQRQMVIDACRRLSPLGPLTDYRYIGFGGREFVDFELVRRALGITQMISMEKDTSGEARYRFNRPFAEIEVLMGVASDLLPSIDFGGPRIVWLDYEQPLDEQVIDDATLVARNLRPGSVLIVTINARPPTRAEGRVDSLASRVGRERIPLGVTDDLLAQWGTAVVQRQILRDAVIRAVRDRADDTFFQQLFNIHYADVANMQTYGGLLLSPAEVEAYGLCRFDELEFVRTGDEAIEIRVPVLTLREILHLNRQLPRESGQALEVAGLPEDDARAYETFYRWYPTPQRP